MQLHNTEGKKKILNLARKMIEKSEIKMATLNLKENGEVL